MQVSLAQTPFYVDAGRKTGLVGDLQDVMSGGAAAVTVKSNLDGVAVRGKRQLSPEVYALLEAALKENAKRLKEEYNFVTGALSGVQNNLTQLKELATKASQAGFSDKDRVAMQKEVDAMLADIDKTFERQVMDSGKTVLTYITDGRTPDKYRTIAASQKSFIPYLSDKIYTLREQINSGDESVDLDLAREELEKAEQRYAMSLGNRWHTNALDTGKVSYSPYDDETNLRFAEDIYAYKKLASEMIRQYEILPEVPATLQNIQREETVRVLDALDGLDSVSVMSQWHSEMAVNKITAAKEAITARWCTSDQERAIGMERWNEIDAAHLRPEDAKQALKILRRDRLENPGILLQLHKLNSNTMLKLL